MHGCQFSPYRVYRTRSWFLTACTDVLVHESSLLGMIRVFEAREKPGPEWCQKYAMTRYLFTTPPRLPGRTVAFWRDEGREWVDSNMSPTSSDQQSAVSDERPATNNQRP